VHTSTKRTRYRHVDGTEKGRKRLGEKEKGKKCKKRKKKEQVEMEK
jgi:hypothetical protein